MAQKLFINFFREFHSLAKKDLLALFKFFNGHLLSLICQGFHKFLSTHRGGSASFCTSKNRKGCSYVVFSDSIDWSVVDKQFQKGLKLQLTHSLFVVIDIVAIPDLVLHIFNFLLGRIEAHTSHHVGNSA